MKLTKWLDFSATCSKCEHGFAGETYMLYLLSSPYQATACCDKGLDGDTSVSSCLNTEAFSDTFPLITERIS